MIKLTLIVSKVFVLFMRLTILLNRIHYLSIHCMFSPKALLTGVFSGMLIKLAVILRSPFFVDIASKVNFID